MSENAKQTAGRVSSDDVNVCFRLRVSLSGHKRLIVTAWDDAGFQPPNHRRIDVQAVLVSEGGKREVIFAKGDTYCGIPQNHCTDSDEAKEAVLSLLAMKPGDTDSDYFASYTEAQLDFASRYGEELSLEAQARYGSR